VLLEPAELGNLRDYLRACRATADQPQTVAVETLLDLALQVATGMRFLDSKGLVHGALAAHSGRARGWLQLLLGRHRYVYVW